MRSCVLFAAVPYASGISCVRGNPTVGGLEGGSKVVDLCTFGTKASEIGSGEYLAESS